MNAPKAANKKAAEERELAVCSLKQTEAQPPASPAENVENKKWVMSTVHNHQRRCMKIYNGGGERKSSFHYYLFLSSGAVPLLELFCFIEEISKVLKRWGESKDSGPDSNLCTLASAGPHRPPSFHSKWSDGAPFASLYVVRVTFVRRVYWAHNGDLCRVNETVGVRQKM